MPSSPRQVAPSCLHCRVQITQSLREGADCRWLHNGETIWTGRQRPIALRSPDSTNVIARACLPLLGVVLVALLAGCASDLSTPRVIFLDGAGWYTGDGPVRAGLRQAGFAGPVERFGWASGLGPLHDHLVVGPSHPRTRALAQRITRLRQANPNGKIVVMGLSAGSRVVVCGLEKLPPTVAVDHVVLLSPSISSRHDLSEALRHVKGRLYFTTSTQDGILSTACSAGMAGGRPAGRAGFVLPNHQSTESRNLYRKVVPLPWRPGYLAYGWDGGHVSATSSNFIRVVIAPRIIDDLPHPLDQPLVSADGGVR
ncbi:MAG TPA: hypothetical protein VMZ31_11060 [Phycisphaerae bacterium]|nr:hypothetical protein [Phycisphaerae bacterium]